MPVVEFKNSRTLRKRVRPPLSLREMCRKMQISATYLHYLESGMAKWPQVRRDEYLQIIEEWKKSPTPRARKKRTTKPKGKPTVQDVIAQAVSKAVPSPVPHPHGELVGIG